MLEGLIPSVGTVGDALDNALCETTIGLYKTECVREGSPFRTGPIGTLADVEYLTTDYVAWFGYAGDLVPGQWAREGGTVSIGDLAWASSRCWFGPLDRVAVS